LASGDDEEAGCEAQLGQPLGDDGRAAGAPKLDARRRRKAAGAALRRMPFPPAREAAAALPPPLPDGGPPFAEASFDAILLDAPCSALGLRPRLSQQVTATALANYASYQRRLLRTAVALLAPGGALVFSTCTISPLENEANVGWLLAEFPDMRLAAHGPRLGGPGLTAPPRGVAWLTAEQAALVQRFTPGEHDTIGFFIARFEKGAN
jgi:16S rRNA C967 or C1407 C5-methylase (RsmB/RsmF family)